MNVELLKELLGVEGLELVMLESVEEFVSLMREKKIEKRRRSWRRGMPIGVVTAAVILGSMLTAYIPDVSSWLT